MNARHPSTPLRPLESLPSERFPDALSLLQRQIVNGVRVRAAVAFVTRAGIDALWELVSAHDGVTIEIVARAADATDPEALVELRKRGAEVRVAIARAAPGFHPKLWLLDDPHAGQLGVLSGSGNLTLGGLCRNAEQFEYWQIDRSADAATEQHRRFDELTERAVPLELVEGGIRWQEWIELRKQQEQARRLYERKERQLAERDPLPGSQDAISNLTHDLWETYRGIVDAALAGETGSLYRPNRFLQSLRRIDEGSANAVTTATNYCRRQSTGFDVLLVNNRRDLTIESLVVDSSKNYHHLFSDRTRALAADRLAQFPSAGDVASVRDSPVHAEGLAGGDDATNDTENLEPAGRSGVESGGAHRPAMRPDQLEVDGVVADLQRQYSPDIVKRLAALWELALDRDAEQRFGGRAVMLWIGDDTSRPLRLGIYVDADQHNGVGSRAGLEFRHVSSRWDAHELENFMVGLQAIPGMAAPVAELRRKGFKGWLSCGATVNSDDALAEFIALLEQAIRGRPLRAS